MNAGYSRLHSGQIGVLNAPNESAAECQSFFHRPKMTKEECERLLRSKPAGTFISRESASLAGGFGIMMKVVENGQCVLRSYLLEPLSGGLHLRMTDEPVFPSLYEFCEAHSIEAMALPSRLVLPITDWIANMEGKGRSSSLPRAPDGRNPACGTEAPLFISPCHSGAKDDTMRARSASFGCEARTPGLPPRPQTDLQPAQPARPPKPKSVSQVPPASMAPARPPKPNGGPSGTAPFDPPAVPPARPAKPGSLATGPRSTEPLVTPPSLPAKPASSGPPLPLPGKPLSNCAPACSTPPLPLPAKPLSNSAPAPTPPPVPTSAKPLSNGAPSPPPPRQTRPPTCASPSAQAPIEIDEIECEVFYFGCMETWAETPVECLFQTYLELVEIRMVVPNKVTLKMAGAGVTILDQSSKNFVRKHYPIRTIEHFEMDPDQHTYKAKKEKELLSIFGMLVKKPGQEKFVCHLFASRHVTASSIIDSVTMAIEAVKMRWVGDLKHLNIDFGFHNTATLHEQNFFYHLREMCACFRFLSRFF